MAYAKRGAALWWALMLAGAVLAAYLLHDHTPEAHLELAPVFLAAALLMHAWLRTATRVSRSRAPGR